MYKKRNDKLRIPIIFNGRFLINLLKVLIHGKLGQKSTILIRDFMGMADLDFYSKYMEIYTLIKSISIVSKDILSGLDSKDHLINHIGTSLENEENKEYIEDTIEPIIISEMAINQEEIKYILETVTTYMKYGFLLKYKNAIEQGFEDLTNGSQHGMGYVVDELSQNLSDIHVSLHKCRNSEEDDYTEDVFITSRDFISNQFEKLYNLAKRKTKLLKTGIKQFNKMLSSEGDGGFITGKMYNIYAPVNSFKTGLLLNIARWIQLYNGENYKEKIKVTGKKPVVLVVSLENTWDENGERFFSMYSNEEMNDVDSVEKAKEMWVENVKKTNSPIEIVLSYARAHKFSPMDLEQKIDEIESRGFFVIATIMDYHRIMKDDQNSADQRLKVINITKDLKEIVSRKNDMVLITAHHTNREGDRTLEELDSRGSVDKVKALNNTHLVDAHGVDEPVDASIFIYPETSPYNGEKYLCFKRGKLRYKLTEVNYFAHHLRNGFYLEDDIDLPHSLSLKSISETITMKDKTNSPIYGETKRTSVREGNNSPNVYSTSVYQSDNNGNGKDTVYKERTSVREDEGQNQSNNVFSEDYEFSF